MSNRRMRERRSLDPARRAVAWLVALAAVVGAGQAGAQTEDDIFLFTSSVAPNVLFQLDNSGSMDEIVWHPAFDPAGAYDCNVFSAATTYVLGSSANFTFCGRTRRLYHDSASTGGTRYTGAYLNWYFSSANTHQTEINNSTNGTILCPVSGTTTYPKYQINRLTAAKRVVLDTMCEVLATKNIRFGLSIFREARDASWVDPNGGFVQVGIDDDSSTHRTALEAAVMATGADSWTPLAETLFQNYTYFMSRTTADLPSGATSGTFPKYSYRTTTTNGGGEYTTTSSLVPGSPIDYTCQKNFVIIITDGFSTRDDFDSDPTSTAQGFSNFGNLIGDYNNDGEVELPGGSESSLYLDDVAKYMHETDCRPDMDGDQTLDVYTIGFTTDATANALLEKAALEGNGLFFTSNNAEELRARLISAITDIIEKAQSFTAATVPSTRTTSGGSFYSSYFLPSAKSAFWEGHLRAFRIDAVGDVYGQSNVCAYLDPDPGECNSGPQNPAVVPFWDAGEQIPATASRKLLTSKLVTGVPTRVAFDTNLTAADLALQTFASPPAVAPNPVYPGTFSLNEEGLADEIVQYVRGCAFGTGTSGANVQATRACVDRVWRLGDVFHSGPAVVSAPRATLSEPSYEAFKTAWANRLRVIYAGANDGFVHAFHAGALDTLVTPPQYQAGTGAELFGFMPWEVRRSIKNLPIDDPTARTYYVDGSPQVVDVWMRNGATDTTKSSAEWKSVLIGGLRQGGRAYYALDVTDPSAAGYPGYLWEFPNEADPDNIAVSTSILPYLGQGFSKPIITRVKVKIDADDNSGAGYERWVAIVTGGYDPTSDPNDAAYVAGAIAGRAILMIDIASGELLAMKRYDAGASDAQTDMDYAIASTPGVLDLNYDGFADLVYVGDLGGQVFKWVIRDIGEDRVNDSSSAGDYSQPNWPLKVFFRAPVENVSGTDRYKSFFFPPQAVYLGRLLYLTFGSGERMDVGYFGDAVADENNRFYSMTDRDPYELNITPYATLTEANLTEVNDSSTCADVNGRGFFFKARDGEKFVTNAEIFQRYVFAGSFEPTTSGDPCTSKGIGRLYAFRIDCGIPLFLDNLGNPKKDIELGEGLPTDPKVSVGVDGEDNRIYIEKSGADLESIGAPDLDFDDGSLIYWREVD
ncbi:MAG: hypothetical protein H6748_05685 [Spirochaetaceae bacterium]|nr:hypothetical protein [Spirochaetaceae bacterium]